MIITLTNSKNRFAKRVSIDNIYRMIPLPTGGTMINLYEGGTFIAVESFDEVSRMITEAEKQTSIEVLT